MVSAKIDAESLWRQNVILHVDPKCKTGIDYSVLVPHCEDSLILIWNAAIMYQTGTQTSKAKLLG